MSEPKPLGLPTMQSNALRIILGKREFRPDEVAQLDYDLLVRSPRIGRKGIVLIRDWLRQFGFDIAKYPAPSPDNARLRKQKQVAKAINVLQRSGFEIQLETLLKPPTR